MGCNPVSQAGCFSSPSKCDIATKQQASSEGLSSVLSQDLQCSFSHTLVIISEPAVENTHLWNHSDFSCFWDHSIETRAESGSRHSDLQTLAATFGLRFVWSINSWRSDPYFTLQLWGCRVQTVRVSLPAQKGSLLLRLLAWKISPVFMRYNKMEDGIFHRKLLSLWGVFPHQCSNLIWAPFFFESKSCFTSKILLRHSWGINPAHSTRHRVVPCLALEKLEALRVLWVKNV